jgi:hypothetical protein
MVAASRAQHAPVILLLQRMRHKARVRVVASKQCAAPCCVCRSVGAQGDGGDGDVDGDGVMVYGDGDGDVEGRQSRLATSDGL